ncbi:MAG: hypothetical protein KKE02_12565 [Alphaproteobacteria bacterium]|nr:hypothetical protein [Alphaproteobacteria bacterium]MBU1512642.1 hypothetical protein [Alphaproteobacteria bacterium]MBU2095036.1 hypothetical protein [Alphaproteobacteria bacterium]MBU2151845.1 hypothetical protein [Alphaproteobacteria bacterium]MBU2306244.1 hypothetical protein [Alphaproteobacteria bacterium]
MTEAIDTGRRAAPWRFWLVTLVSLLWNGFGGYDYTMSHLQGETYYRQMGMTEAQIALMASFPVWMHAVWAIGVWGSVAGSLLLLARSRWAVHAFALSALGAAGSLIYNLITPAAAAAMSPVMPAVIVVICLFFVWYAWTMTKRGVLR